MSGFRRSGHIAIALTGIFCILGRVLVSDSLLPRLTLTSFAGPYEIVITKQIIDNCKQ